MGESFTKHCGKQREWRIDIENMKKKCGST